MDTGECMGFMTPLGQDHHSEDSENSEGPDFAPSDDLSDGEDATDRESVVWDTVVAMTGTGRYPLCFTVLVASCVCRVFIFRCTLLVSELFGGIRTHLNLFDSIFCSLRYRNNSTMQGRISGERPETPVQTPSEEVRFEKEILDWVVSRGRGSLPDWGGFAKTWNNEVKMIKIYMRGQLLVEDKEEDGSVDDVAPSSSAVRYVD